MVNKVGKYGTRSGNTFRKSNAKFLHRHRRSAFIVRSHVGDRVQADATFQTMGVLGEDQCMPDGVVFSLNKQNRWELPEIIEDIISYSDRCEDYGVQIVQRYNLKRTSNCFRVCATDGILANDVLAEKPLYSRFQIFKKRHGYLKIKRNGYFQSESILPHNLSSRNAKRRRFSRRHRHVTSETDDSESASETAQIRYDVHYPPPATSFLAYDARAIGLKDPSEELQKLLKKPSGIRGKNGRHRIRRGNKSYLHEQMELVDDPDFLDEVTNDWEDHHAVSHGYRSTRTLHDALQSARNSHKLQFEHDKYVQDDSGEYEANSIEEWANCEGNDAEFTQSNKSYVNVILQSDDIETADLQQRYGNAFVECRCYPRKFIINISKQLQDCVQQLYGTSRSLREGAYLVFVHDINNDVNTQEQPVYKVSLHHPFNDKPVESEAVKTLFDYMYADVDEIVNNTLFYMETLPIEHHLDRTNSGIEEDTNLSVVEQNFKWYTCTYNPNNIFLLNDFLDVDNPSNRMLNELENDFEVNEFGENLISSNGKTCSICCDVIDGTFPGTSLRLCAHWFCNTCWAEHISSSIEHARGPVQCPAYGCKVDIDAGTFVTLMDFSGVLRYASLCHDNVVAREKDRIWCPNEKCGLVLKVNTVDAKIAHCRCGNKVCVQCLDRAHWPADCNSVKEHNKTLHETGDMVFLKTVVYTGIFLYGKECPWCHRFVEKNGGCPYVACVCGKAFCWGCNLPWKECTMSEKCGTRGERDRHGTNKIYMSSFALDDVKERSTFYELALRHRLNQNPSKVEKMTIAMKSMAKLIRRHLLSIYGADTSLDFTAGNKVYARECDKIKDYLTSTVDLYIEANQVIESSAIFLSSWEAIDEDGMQIHTQIERLAKVSEKLFDLFVHENLANNPMPTLVEKLKRTRSNVVMKLQAFIEFYDSIDV